MYQITLLVCCGLIYIQSNIDFVQEWASTQFKLIYQVKRAASDKHRHNYHKSRGSKGVSFTMFPGTVHRPQGTEAEYQAHNQRTEQRVHCRYHSAQGTDTEKHTEHRVLSIKYKTLIKGHIEEQKYIGQRELVMKQESTEYQAPRARH